MLFDRKNLPALLLWTAFIVLLCGLGQLTAPASGTRSFFAQRDESPLDADSIAAIYQQVEQSVVGVMNVSDDGAGNLTLASGSGVILTADGYIVTNYHVVAQATELSVSLADGRSVAARLIGAEPAGDLALLKAELEHLTPATLGSSGELRVGDLVFPIGNPGGEQFARSMTMGLVSGLDRKLVLADGNLYTLLQTDAAINPGNSGGPLVNREGVVVGINSAKIVDADFEGMGFAIPADTVQAFLQTCLPQVFSRTGSAGKKAE